MEPIAAAIEETESALGLSTDDFEMINNDLLTEGADNDGNYDDSWVTCKQ